MQIVELSSRAVRDAKSIARQDRNTVLRAIEEILAADSTPDNADIRPLTGKMPWRRLRVGDWRVLYRPGSSDEPFDVLVARIVNRRDLERALKTL